MLTWTDPDHPVPNRKYDTHLAQILRLCHLLEQEVIENMKVRTHVEVRAGQVWRASDPRRLYAFRVLGGRSPVIVQPIFPSPGRQQSVLMEPGAFLRLGTKGYTRVS